MRGNKFVTIRVKTKTSTYSLFQWNAKRNGDIFLGMTPDRDFCILVDIPEDAGAGPTSYIVPTPTIDKWLRDDFKMWVTTPGARGQQRAENNKRRLFYVDDDLRKLGHGYRARLAPYMGAWELLAG